MSFVPDEEWIQTGQEIYGRLRQTETHEKAIEIMVLRVPDVAPEIYEYADTWCKGYQKA